MRRSLRLHNDVSLADLRRTSVASFSLAWEHSSLRLLVGIGCKVAWKVIIVVITPRKRAHASSIVPHQERKRVRYGMLMLRFDSASSDQRFCAWWTHNSSFEPNLPTKKAREVRKRSRDSPAGVSLATYHRITLARFRSRRIISVS